MAAVLQEPLVCSRTAVLISVVLIENEAYLGGKSLDNTGGKVTDFLLQNPISSRLLIVEIKTPITKLLESTPYRQNVFGPSRELAGCVAQALTQRATLLKEAHIHQSNTGGAVKITEPKCLVLVGRHDSLTDSDQQESFELYRANQKLVDIVTFDELFRTVQDLITLMQSSTES